MEQEGVVGGIAAPRHNGERCRLKQVVGQELQHQCHVDVHSALELGQCTDVHRGLLEVRVLLEALGGHHVPEPIDNPLALGRHLHLCDWVEQQVAPIVRGR